MSKYDNSVPMAHEAVMSWQAGEITRLKADLAEVTAARIYLRERDSKDAEIMRLKAESQQWEINYSLERADHQRTKEEVEQLKAQNAMMQASRSTETDRLKSLLAQCKEALEKVNATHDELSDAIQSDFENGVKFLSERAAESFKQEYPRISEALFALEGPTREIDDVLAAIEKEGL